MKYLLSNNVSIELPNELKGFQFSGLDFMVGYGQTMPTFKLVLQGTDYPVDLKEIRLVLTQGDNIINMTLSPHTISVNYNLITYAGIPLPRELCITKKSLRYQSFSDIESSLFGLELDSEITGDTSYNIYQVNMSTRKFLSQFLRGVNRDIIFGFDTERLIIKDLTKSDTLYDKIYKYDQMGVITDESVFRSALDDEVIKEDDYQEITTLVYGYKSLTFDSVNKRFMENYVENMRNDNELNLRSSFNAKFNMLMPYRLLDRVKIGKTMINQEYFYVTNIITSVTQEGGISQSIKFS